MRVTENCRVVDFIKVNFTLDVGCLDPLWRYYRSIMKNFVSIHRAAAASESRLWSRTEKVRRRSEDANLSYFNTKTFLHLPFSCQTSLFVNSTLKSVTAHYPALGSLNPFGDLSLCSPLPRVLSVSVPLRLIHHVRWVTRILCEGTGK